MGEAGALADWWVYLLGCGDGTCYTGITTDVARRLAEHAAGKGARYTRGRLPVTLLGALPCATRSEAARLEASLRRLPPDAKQGLVREWPSPSPSGRGDRTVSPRKSDVGPVHSGEGAGPRGHRRACAEPGP